MTNKTFFISALPLFLVACMPDIEVAEGVDKIYNQKEVMQLAEDEFIDWYGLSSSNAFEKAEVYWTDTPCPYQDGYPQGKLAVVFDGKCYRGIMWSCDKIFVAMDKNNPNRTCLTALMVEFGHCLLMDAGLDLDRNHTDKEFWWDFITVVKQETCDRGW